MENVANFMLEANVTELTCVHPVADPEGFRMSSLLGQHYFFFMGNFQKHQVKLTKN